MKPLPIALTVLSINACKPELKKQYIVRHLQVRSLNSDTYHNEVKLDSIEVESDSAAYWQGVISFTANKQAEKLLRNKGVKNLPTLIYEFDVLNERYGSIRGKITHEQRMKANQFIKEHD